ncbi:hypothetical protein K504DRAFT_461307 [Pleomassaria siparia CBS 279.74]|uniref:Uncharacterized protein n=1 Tax=Pleomassaria siparia CBS 279.74 TaxID=1314801 RepID=A0A6G1JVB0_9PLEO|nr:hypothetical protein K504DRAFT_461307 [Pleomassaria siparia CBS 279.74]
MAPTPTETTVPTSSTTATPVKAGWDTASIVGASIFGGFLLLVLVVFAAFLIHRRVERSKLPPSHRPTPYHPFRTNSAKDGLLTNVAPITEKERKPSMFSNERHSSVSLYVDHNAHNRRSSTETALLIPLSVSPVGDIHKRNPMDMATASVGSATTRGSSRLGKGSSRTVSSASLGMSGNNPVSEPEIERPAGARRMSTATATRYYDITTSISSSAPPVPQIPNIAHATLP